MKKKATATAAPPTETMAATLRLVLTAWREAEANWVEATMVLAEKLRAVREMCGDNNNAYGEWLDANGFDDLDKNDRAALVKLAEHPDLAREVLAETTRRSIRHIWKQEVEPRLPRPQVGTTPPPEAPPPAERSEPASPSEWTAKAAPTPSITPKVLIVDVDAFIAAMALMKARAARLSPKATELIDEIESRLDQLKQELRREMTMH